MGSWQGFYDELAHARYPALLAYAVTLTANRADAEDLVHDALVRTFSKGRRLDNAVHAERYVRRAIASIYIDRQRKRASWWRAAPRLATTDSVPDATPEIDHRSEIANALAHLSPQVRAAIVLHYLDDLSVEQAARVMHVSVGAVKRYLSDGRGALRQALGASLLEAPDTTYDLADVVSVQPAKARRRS
ncbi:MAG: RNA polymerase subunit sigma-24 [Actinobacteria bacterium HGW-Actinobacteria-4]|nr:MAG: RNA polymerase subunit sigma-24 [Actinobacteria bacterium HGW-Actinobacteria-4]